MVQDKDTGVEGDEEPLAEFATELAPASESIYARLDTKVARLDDNGIIVCATKPPLGRRDFQTIECVQFSLRPSQVTQRALPFGKKERLETWDAGIQHWLGRLNPAEVRRCPGALEADCYVTRETARELSGSIAPDTGIYVGKIEDRIPPVQYLAPPEALQKYGCFVLPSSTDDPAGNTITG